MPLVNIHALPPHTRSKILFGSFPLFTLCVSTRLPNYPCGVKDKGQSKVIGDDTLLSCMDSTQIISYNMLGFPVWTCGCMFFFVFHDQPAGDRWCVGFRERARGFSLGEKHSERHCYHFHVGLLGKRLTNGHRWMAYKKESLGKDSIQSAHLFSWLQDSHIVYGL